MASRYIQKYPIPQDFPTVLKNFTREVLRDQPPNIIEYSARYFEALEKGEPFEYKSAFNVPRAEKQYELCFDARKAEEVARRDLRINRQAGGASEKEKERAMQLVELLFARFDRDRSGYLDSKELKEMINSIYSDGQVGRKPTDIEMMSFISQIDSNHNAKIDKQELFAFVKSTLL
jgi:hypothetical protein